MRAYVVETNVAIVANNRPQQTRQADRHCILACIGKLVECAKILKGTMRGRLVLDDGGEIESEYAAYLSRSGQPGVGDEFFLEVNRYGYGPNCERVAITPCDGSYAEFPDCVTLAGFDPSDRKFVAAALASRHSPSVLNAVDSDWRDYQQELEAAGVRIEQLCPDCLRDRKV